MLVLSIDLRSTSTFAIKCWQTSGKSQWKHPELHQCRHRMLDRVQVPSMAPGWLFLALWQPASATEALSTLRIHWHIPSSTCNHTTSTHTKAQTKNDKIVDKFYFSKKTIGKTMLPQAMEIQKNKKHVPNAAIRCPPFSYFQPPNPLLDPRHPCFPAAPRYWSLALLLGTLKARRWSFPPTSPQCPCWKPSHLRWSAS